MSFKSKKSGKSCFLKEPKKDNIKRAERESFQTKPNKTEANKKHKPNGLTLNKCSFLPVQKSCRKINVFRKC